MSEQASPSRGVCRASSGHAHDHGHASVERWLAEFADAVRRRDFAAGRVMFFEGVTSFGTVAGRADEIDDLQSRQWERVWPFTRGFHFVDGTIRIDVSGSRAWATAEWRSEGIAADGRSFPRSGRATLILHEHASGWLAHHTHFSFDPSIAASRP